jgi:hypothetical protein
MAECIQSGCDGYRKSKLGYCEAHLKRYKRGADMSPPIKRYGKYGKFCTECGRPAKTAGLCPGHYTQLWRGHDLAPLRLPSIHDEVAYEAAHFRPRALWGSASKYSCVDCGECAQDWAYDGTDPDQLLGGSAREGRASIMFYSRYPEFYMPMCRKCHSRRDGAAQQRELYEYRMWKHRTGMTLADLDESLIRELKAA